AYICHFTGDCRRSDHHRTHQYGSAFFRSLSPDEVPVRGGGTGLIALQLVSIHPETHRTARTTPLEARLAEGFIESVVLGGAFDALAARHDHRAHARIDLPSVDHRGGGTEVRQSGVRTRTQECNVDVVASHRLAGIDAHVLLRSPCSLLFVRGKPVGC